MKTSIIQLSIIVVVLTTSFFAGRIQSKGTSQAISMDKIVRHMDYNSANDQIITRATRSNGEIIPVVSLPELVIEGEVSTDMLVRATLKDGEVMPYVTLPTLTIEAEI